MNKETLRMQMLSGIITESEYKAKLEEKDSLNENALVQIAKDSTSFNEFKDKAFTHLQNISKSPYKTSNKPTQSLIKSLRNIWNDYQKGYLDSYLNEAKLQEKDSLNEHYIAGGIVGIGAINQIPPRTKAVYEDAFEYFLSQKYSLNEVEEDQAVAAAEKVEDSVEDKVNIDDLSDKEKNQLRDALSRLGITADSSIEDVADKIENKIESTLSEAEENPNKKFSDALSAVGGGLLASHLVPLIPLIVGHMSGIGFFGGLAVTLGTAGALIGLAKALGDGLEEGKENEDDMPEAPSHEETDANQVYEEEINEARISPDNAVAYLENTLGHVWNMGTGKNNIDLQSLAQSIAQDLGLIEDLEEAKKPGTFKERSAMAKKARAGKDIGEKGKNFEKIAKSAAKQYGSEEAGKKVAGAVMYGKLNK